MNGSDRRLIVISTMTCTRTSGTAGMISANGSIGNMGCHVLDGVYWALKCEHPTSIEAEQLRGGSDERYPTGSRVRWDIRRAAICRP